MSKVGLKWDCENENVCVYNGRAKRAVWELCGGGFGALRAFLRTKEKAGYQRHGRWNLWSQQYLHSWSKRDAVAWAVESGVTKGTSTVTFKPAESCTRAQIVTFLYRAYQGK